MESNMKRNTMATCAFFTGFSVLWFAHASAVADFAAPSAQLIKAGTATIEVAVEGSGPTVVFVPSYGRGADDFADLAKRVAGAGFRAVLPQPRGIGQSAGPLQGLTLHDWAADVAAVVEATGDEPATIIGHAFGNRVARMVAADHPRIVKQLILLAAGGAVPAPPEIMDALARVFDERLSRTEHLAAVKAVFFERDHDPSVWEHGWHPDVYRAQRSAADATALASWWGAGSAPMLVLQAAEDAIAVPANSERLHTEYPSRVTLIKIPRSGHAMLPEQPDLIASLVIGYLKRQN
jgi:pimeloyl-ACP methyl ester carboxylesterase